VSDSNSASYGKPSLPIKRKYILAALDLLIEGGIILRTKNKVTPKLHENKITFLLCFEMDHIQRARKSDIIWWDPLVNTQYDPLNPLSRGEIDIKFRWAQYPSDNDRYLAVEAKRLFGKGSSRADEYVEKGVMDFINAKYGRGHNYGIMLGYILVGPLTKAIATVDSAMNMRKLHTAEHSAFAPNSSLCLHPYTNHSVHLQQGTATLITLVHVFLDFS
jgi:hypothetical protein